MTVIRYDIERTSETDFDMVEYPYGDYVRYDDYLALQEENAELKKRLEKVAQILTELTLEF